MSQRDAAAADRLCLDPVLDRPEFKRERAVAPRLLGVVGHQFSAVDQNIGADGALYADEAQSHADAHGYCRGLDVECVGKAVAHAGCDLLRIDTCFILCGAQFF